MCVHLFVSASPSVSIPELARVFKCVSAKLLFDEFPKIKEQFWGGHLWSEGYTLSGLQALLLAQESRNISTEPKRGCSPRKRRVVHLISVLFKAGYSVVHAS